LVHSARIQLAALPNKRDETCLPHAMGWETAKVHLGSAKGRTLATDLKARPPRGYRAAKKMERP
jgi:hypothetical protein